WKRDAGVASEGIELRDRRQTNHPARAAELGPHLAGVDVVRAVRCEPNLSLSRVFAEDLMEARVFVLRSGCVDLGGADAAGVLARIAVSDSGRQLAVDCAGTVCWRRHVRARAPGNIRPAAAVHRIQDLI